MVSPTILPLRGGIVRETRENLAIEAGISTDLGMFFFMHTYKGFLPVESVDTLRPKKDFTE
jgi:hypothetical protein